MAITVTNLTAAYDNVDSSSTASASISPASGSLLVCFIGTAANAAATAANITSISGLSLSWTEITTIVFSGTGSAERRISAWKAQCGSSPGSGACTINLDGTSLGTGHSIEQVLGHNTSSPIVQNPTNSGGSATSGSVTLSAVTTTGNLPMSGWWHRANEGKTARTNWSELGDAFGSSPSVGLETQWRSDTFETTASASWSTSQPWGAIALEIAIGGGGPPFRVPFPRPTLLTR